MITEEQVARLKELAHTIRKDILLMLHKAGSGHTGGSLSIADIITYLFFYKMRFNPKSPNWSQRDRFVLSKGHGAPAYYAALARLGVIDMEDLKHLRELGSPLQGHPDSRLTQGVEVSTGSLGQGLSMANGMALASRLDNIPNRIYVILGDGEIQEGQIWEAAMTAAHHRLSNLYAILDNNGLQIDGPVKEVKRIEPIADKWRAFGWEVFEADGHDFYSLDIAFEGAEKVKDKPSIIIAHTIKGKGASIFEGKVNYHGVAPNDEELNKALEELDSMKNKDFHS